MKETKRRTAAQMFPMISQWEHSGQSKIEFCTTHQINVHTFGYWQKKYQQSQQSDSSDFLALEINASDAAHKPIHLRYPNGVELHLSNLPEKSLLIDLLKMKI